MTFTPDCLRPLSTHADCPEPDLVLYSHNRFVAASLEHFLLTQFPSRRVIKGCTPDAVENIVRSSPDVRLIAVLSEGSAEALAQFRTLLHLHCYSQLKLMVLADDASNGLRPLLTSARWLSLKASAEQVFKEILIWLTSPASLHSPAPLSQLTPRQYIVLFMLAHGVSLSEVASTLGISLRTVLTHRFDIQTRLGISCRADWLLFCAAVSEFVYTQMQFT